jgi:hypothetical protein
MKLFMLSFSSSLLFADKGEGDRWPEGEAGEMALDGWDGASEGEPEARILSGMLVSEARRISLPGPIRCFNMNFSSQAELVASGSDSPAVKLKVAALSLSSSLVTSTPSFLECLTQFVNAFSTSTPFPFPGRLTGELLRPSELRYLSLFRKTLDTVLVIASERTGKWRTSDVVLKSLPPFDTESRANVCLLGIGILFGILAHFPAVLVREGPPWL